MEVRILLSKAEAGRILNSDSRSADKRKSHIWDILREKLAGRCDQMDMESEE